MPRLAEVSTTPRSVGSIVAAFALGVAGCASQSIPDPHDAARAYAAAAQHGDADAIYGMMSKSARETRSKDDVRKIVADEKAELAEQAAAFAAKDSRVEATARLRFDDGEEAALELKDGSYWITASGALPGGARTPDEALDQLRRVLARRSFAGLLRVLSPRTRALIEVDLRGLVDGLDRADTLQVPVSGDVATVAVPGGHHVRLKRDAGVWHVDNFD